MKKDMLPVPVLPEMKLIFFAVACMMLSHFGLLMKIMLTALGCLVVTE